MYVKVKIFFFTVNFLKLLKSKRLVSVYLTNKNAFNYHVRASRRQFLLTV